MVQCNTSPDTIVFFVRSRSLIRPRLGDLAREFARLSIGRHRIFSLRDDYDALIIQGKTLKREKWIKRLRLPHRYAQWCVLFYGGAQASGGL
jgi:hypothetical protein